MAAEKLRLLGRCLCLVVIMSASASSTQDYAELVARLYRQAVRNNKPLVVVLDQSRQQRNQEVGSSSNEEGQVSELSRLLKQLQQKLRTRTALQPPRHQHGKLHNYEKYPSRGRSDRFRALLQQFADRTQGQQPRHKPAPKYQQQRYRHEDDTLGSKNVVKSLLRLRNSLSCNARDNCKRRCRRNAFRERSVNKCVYKCEITFTCQQVTTPAPAQPSECESGQSGCSESNSCEGGDDSCGDADGEANISTRAPHYDESCNPNEDSGC